MNRTRSLHARLAGALLLAGLPLGVGVVEGQPAPGGSARALNLGPVINTPAREAEPTFTPDGNTMYFNCFDRGQTPGSDICVARRVGGEWSPPEVVGPPISTPEHLEVEPLLTPDGKRLYLMSDRPGGLGSMDIWYSDFVDGQWSELRNVGAPINSPYMDHCLFFAGENWDIAYWTSTRPGGYGGNDIWTSVRVDGVWQEAVNLGPEVNSAASEHHSLPSADGGSLYITSDRSGGLGGEDIYVSTRREDGGWGALVNLGPTVNTPEHDRCPAFSPDYAHFYWDSERPGGAGGKDLWWIGAEALPRGSGSAP